MHYKCGSCGASLGSVTVFPVYCVCGYKARHSVELIPVDKKPVAVDQQGLEHAAICRSNKCGHYDKDTDTCKEVIRLGLLKDPPQVRKGEVGWIESHPDAHCCLPDGERLF